MKIYRFHSNMSQLKLKKNNTKKQHMSVINNFNENGN